MEALVSEIHCGNLNTHSMVEWSRLSKSADRRDRSRHTVPAPQGGNKQRNRAFGREYSGTDTVIGNTVCGDRT